MTCTSCGKRIEGRPIWQFSVTPGPQLAQFPERNDRFQPGFVPIHPGCATYIEPRPRERLAIG